MIEPGAELTERHGRLPSVLDKADLDTGTWLHETRSLWLPSGGSYSRRIVMSNTLRYQLTLRPTSVTVSVGER